MLQQTRVSTVIPYYERFLARFPDVTALANASEEEVLRHWAGLGYYSRGRNLQRAAQAVVRVHCGRFPSCSSELRKLPGIGEYTAAAVGSIAFGEPVPVLDGNVERVLCRLHAIPGDPKARRVRERLHALASGLIPANAAGTYNEAMMELGALICTPRAPRCEECPVGELCAARREGDPMRYPRPREKRAPESQHWVAALIRSEAGHWLVEAAPDAELLRGHWGVPIGRIAMPAVAPRTTAPELAPKRLAAAARKLVRTTFGCAALGAVVKPAVRHAITYRRLTVHPVEVRVTIATPSTVRLCPPSQCHELPALHRKILGAADAEPKVARATGVGRGTKGNPPT